MPTERTPKTADPSAPAAPPDWRRLRLWHIQPVRDIMVVALVFGILYFGYVLRSITVPMLLALLLAYLFEPLVKRMTRGKRVSRPGAALIIIAGFFFVAIVPIGVGLSVGIVQAVSLLQGVATKTGELVEAIDTNESSEREMRLEALPVGWRYIGKEINKFRGHLPELRKSRKPADADANGAQSGSKTTSPDVSQPTPPDDAPQPPPDAKPDAAPTDVTDPDNPDAQPADAPRSDDEPSEFRKQIYGAAYTGIEWIRANAENLAKSIGQTAITTGQSAVATAIAFLTTLAVLSFGAFLTAFFFFFFSTSWGRVLDFWTSLIPERKKGVAFDLIDKMDNVIAGFVRGRLTICALMALFHTLAYWLIGMPVPFIVGPIAGLLYIVPFLHILTIPIGILLLLLQPSAITWQATWWWIVFAPIIVDVAGQFLDDWVLSPFIQGKTTDLDVPTILFASMAGGALAGMYGLLVAIPVAACIRILVKELFWPKFRRWARGEERDFLPISSSEEGARTRAK